MEPFIPVLGMFLSFGLIGWIVWLLNRTRRERVKGTLDLQNRLLEKFATSQEFISFLHTPEGRMYMKSIGEAPRRNPREKILRSIRTGVVLIILAAGLIAISFMVDLPMDEPPFVIGFLALFMGIGFIGSAVVSWTLSRAWGLMPDESKEVIPPLPE